MSNRRPTLDEFIAEFTNDEDDGAPCCPDPECPGRRGRSCTFGGYADNH